MRCGRAGIWRIETPVACRMAPRIAGAAGTSAGSPTPFAPKGPSGSGASIRMTSILGTSPKVGNEIIVQIFRPARNIFFHQGEPDALGDAAMDLPLHQGRIDGAPDVVGRDEAVEPDRAEPHVDIERHDLGGKAVGRVGHPLALDVERFRRRVEIPQSLEDDAVGAAGPGAKIDHRARARERHRETRAFEGEARVRPGIGVPQDFGPQGERGVLGGLAGNEGLAGRRGFAGVESLVGISRDEGEDFNRQTQGVGGDLRQHRGRALADIDRAIEEQELSFPRRARGACARGSRAPYCRSRTTCRRCRRRGA